MNQFYFVSSQKMASHRSLILVSIKESNMKPLFALDLNWNKEKVRKKCFIQKGLVDLSGFVRYIAML